MKQTKVEIELVKGKPMYNRREVVLHERLLAQLINEGDIIEISPLAVKFK